MKNLKIGTILWHPLSLDIIDYKIISKTEYEDRTVYTAKAIHNVGACGKVEVILEIDRKNIIRFVSLADDYEYDSGLQDFVEGKYYIDKNKAKMEFYQIQLNIVKANMRHELQLYNKSKDNYNRIQKIINTIKE